MDINSIVQLIRDIGFPIFCCVYLLKEIEKLRATVDNNTRVMWALCNKLGVDINIDSNDPTVNKL